MNRAVWLVVALLTMGLTVETVSAQEPWRSAIRQVDYKDSKTIPPFCQVNSPNYNGKRYKQMYGPDFTWLNHYCEAKAKIPVCWKYPERPRKQCLSSMVSGVHYSIKNAKDPNYKLLPFLYTELGALFKDLERYGDAVREFQNAIKKKPNYAPAYARLSDVYVELGDLELAEKTLRQGLAQKDSKSLKRRLAEVEGLIAEKAAAPEPQAADPAVEGEEPAVGEAAPDTAESTSQVSE